jgi:PD-(D/E)XK nuclease superfamily
MSLVLVTGPANAAKAGAVFARLRATLPRGPLLVVPRAADVEHYQRELAAGGLVFGVEVATFGRLMRAIARAAGVPGRPLGRLARERVVRAAIADVHLRVLARSAAAPGFAVAAGALFAELQRTLVTPARFTQALRAWVATGGRSAYAEELAALYSAYRRRLDALERHDEDGFAWAALDALRAAPARWGGRPVFLYGFDELSRVQLDAVETLSRDCDVCVALPYEPGRVAFAGRAATVELLRPPAAEHVALGDRSEHYAEGSRAALHHLERNLFEPIAEPRDPNGAVRLLEAGGERAEAELVGAEILELMREGVAPADIAVLVRGSDAARLVEQVLVGYGLPVAHERRAPLARTRLGAGVLAFARAALPGGRAQDLVTWLRTPGRLPSPEPADALDAAVRKRAVESARTSRAIWEGELGGEPLTALDELADTTDQWNEEEGGPSAFLAVLAAEAVRIWAAPHRRQAAILGPEAAADAQVAGDLRGALGELRSLADTAPELLGEPADVLDALGAVRVREGSGAPGGLLLADPLAIRARRFRAVFVCGLQDGEFPRSPVPDPFLDDGERRALAAASGLVLPMHEDVLARDRYLFYACVSRPEEVLFLSWRSSDEEGDPQPASPFVADARALFTDALWERRGRRLLAEVTWPPGEAPTPLELRRALAAAERAPEPPPLPAPTAPAVLAGLAARDRESARGLETYAACGVRWLVERILRPERAEPEPEPMRRGSLAHTVLERTLRGLRERTGSARLTSESLPAALEELEAALAEVGGSHGGARARALRRSLEADLQRSLREEAAGGPAFEPAQLEWSFGGEDDAHGPLELAEAGLGISGRVDRIDLAADGRTAIVRDYKGRTVHPAARWERDRRLQVALYLLAVRDLLGYAPAAGLYQPLAGPALQARGLVRAGLDGPWTRTDVVDDEAFEAVLEQARAMAVAAARAIRAGELRSCPELCSYVGCAYPTICRAAQ